MKTTAYNTGFSIWTTAVLAVCVLIGASVWSLWPTTAAAPIGNATSTRRAVSADATNTLDSLPTVSASSSVSQSVMDQLVASYSALKDAGAYATDTIQTTVTAIHDTLPRTVTYNAVTVRDIHTTPDISYTRMLAYRTDLQHALKPLLANKQSELELFSRYIQQSDATALDKLRAASANYQTAASSTLMLTVPTDAVDVHVGIVNAMRKFAATVDRMIARADDPIESAHALQLFTQSQNDMVAAFNDIAMYISHKQL